MTKADLIDEVSRLAELTRKDSEVIVETIFDSVVRSLRVEIKSKFAASGASEPGNESPGSAAIPRRATGSKSLQKRSRSSSPARN